MTTEFDIVSRPFRREALADLYESEEGCDIKFVLKDSKPDHFEQQVEFLAHKLILRLASAEFHQMFFGQQEGDLTKDETGLTVVEIANTEPKIFSYLLRFIYMKTVSPESAAELLSLYKLGEAYDVVGLKEAIMGCVSTGKMDTVCMFYVHSHSSGDTELKRMCKVLLRTNLAASGTPADDSECSEQERSPSANAVREKAEKGNGDCKSTTATITDDSDTTNSPASTKSYSLSKGFITDLEFPDFNTEHCDSSLSTFISLKRFYDVNENTVEESYASSSADSTESPGERALIDEINLVVMSELSPEKEDFPEQETIDGGRRCEIISRNGDCESALSSSFDYSDSEMGDCVDLPYVLIIACKEALITYEMARGVIGVDGSRVREFQDVCDVDILLCYRQKMGGEVDVMFRIRGPTGDVAKAQNWITGYLNRYYDTALFWTDTIGHTENEMEFNAASGVLMMFEKQYPVPGLYKRSKSIPTNIFGASLTGYRGERLKALKRETGAAIAIQESDDGSRVVRIKGSFVQVESATRRIDQWLSHFERCLYLKRMMMCLCKSPVYRLEPVLPIMYEANLES